MATLAPYTQPSELNTLCMEVRARLTNANAGVRQAAFQCLIKLVAHLPYAAQREFISTNSCDLLSTEFQETFYQLVNCLISQKSITDSEVYEVLQLMKDHDPILHIFFNHFSHLLDEHMPTDLKQFKL